MSIYLIVLFGVSIGITARMLLPGKERWDWFVSITLGILGAALGVALGSVIGLYREGEPAGLVCAAFGAALLLFAYYVGMQRRRWRERREIR